MPATELRTRPTTVAVVGASVIAASYGLGRYAFGLFVPRFQADLELSATTIGAIGGGSHLGYAVGLVAAPWASARFGAARVAVLAGVVVSLGLAGVAASVGPGTLGAAVLVAGTASGLASPALALVVTERLPADHGPAAQTWVNSGTSVGLIVSAPAVLAAAQWRATWAIFAAAAMVVAAIAHVVLVRPAGRPAPRPAGSVLRRGRRRLPLRILAHAVTLGATSASYWTFSRQRVLDAGLSEGWSVGFWVVIGLLGLAGGSAGATASHRGLGTTLRRWKGIWIVSLGVLAVPTLPGWVALTSAGGFGAAYMALTGLLIVWAVSHLPGDASAGVRTAFLALGVGQAIATPIVGWLGALGGLPITFVVSALASAALLALAPRSAPQPDDTLATSRV